ncbi:hypothetical protein COCVIDRAFT_107041 [Bipolaris victoriae FI3]|uniref:Uncharacterized protein n=1 Tax=Bipolaris victoriae (strain FI3) TaxID=930091 RepID=W7E7H6_BIPV3|nr:hypothetical protein COCVIDRAFT_107041 [Bipolaris victoriae FI3]
MCCTENNFFIRFGYYYYYISVRGHGSIECSTTGGYALRMYDPWSERAWGTRYAFQRPCDPLPSRAATLSRALVGPKSDTSACGIAHALDALGREPFPLSR